METNHTNHTPHQQDDADVESFRVCALYQTLGNRVRRDIIHALADYHHDTAPDEDATPLRAFDLAAAVSVAGDGDVPQRHREAVIHQNHLPYLDDHGFLTYDTYDNTVTDINTRRVEMAAGLDDAMTDHLDTEWGEPVE